MTVHEFAERIVFSASLEEKLAAPPENLIDEPGAVVSGGVPSEPGRPAILRPAAYGDRIPLPGLPELERAAGRGLLLHFFANHELLATELMALALLRFPAAPAEFRRGLLRTLRDEQEHTRLYLRRMAECGVSFGDYPVNDYFWRMVSGMETPLDYVTRLSLTFEQANLDYSRHYAALFRQAGDEDTGKLLDRIYRDEIAHVGYGLKWFRKWKEPGRTDWNEFSRVLTLPLSAVRARGASTPFDAEGRRRAGLEEDFIESLRLFSRSRGRTPDVCFFNPSAETCAAAGSAAPALTDRTTRVLAQDLDLLPLFQCHRDDVVLVRRTPAAAHLRRLLAAGVPPPEFHVLDSKDLLPADSPLRTRRLGRLRPWGWSPDSIACLGDLTVMSGKGTAPPEAAAMCRLYSKAEAVPLVQRAGSALAAFNGEAPPLVSAAAHSEQEAVSLAREMAALSPGGGVVLKAPWGLAGRGLLFCREAASGLPAHAPGWIAEVFAAQGSVVVEPLLSRLADFSAHYEVDEPGALPRLCGMVRLHNDPAGRFLGCTATPVFTRLLSPEIARWLHHPGTPPGGLLPAIYRDVLPGLLQEHLAGIGFTGWLGIDAFFHRLAGGGVALRPVCELNPRSTMGRVTLDLRRFVHPAQPASFRIFHRRRLAAQGFAGLKEFAASLEQTHPVVMASPAGSGILSGALALNDPGAAQQFLAVLHAGKPRAGDTLFPFPDEAS